MKSRRNFLLCGLWFLLLPAPAVQAQVGIVDRNAKTKPALVILGTYHMGTPGTNVVNPEVADVGAPLRQRQMVELVERLKKFRPTKIVVECDSEDDAKTQVAYEKYVSGNYQLSKNETNQIGFRLAKELGHKKVYCVDWSDFWDDPSVNYLKYAAKDPELDAFLKQWQSNLKKEIDAEYAKLLPLTIVDQLAYVNRPDQIDKDNQRYFDQIRIGRGNEYVGAAYVAWWYRRNLVSSTTSSDLLILLMTESS